MTEKNHARRRAKEATDDPAGETPAAVYEHVEPDPHPSPLPEGEGTERTTDGEATDPQAELEAERAKANEYLEQWRRTAADFSNFKRRNEQERGEMAKLFNESLVRSLLPVLDNFERALASMPEDFKGNGWTEGVTLTEKQLRAALEKEGLNAIEAVGQKFDPNLHEAVAHDVSDEHEDDSVIEEFQRGYKLHDRVIRPSMVKVSRRN
jgi:molecular chaperone GrpE